MARPTYQNLIDENLRLREENRQLRLRADTLETQVRKLTALLEQAQRTGKRQAAPFSKGTPKQDPKTPGRKPGEHYGPKAHRPLPEPNPHFSQEGLTRPPCPGINVYTTTSYNQDKEVNHENTVYTGIPAFSSPPPPRY